ncbi:MAG: hypothetical protein NT159_07890 [Proteobacteria bacterium]|nr:hypothetical protein [Pseudomonadota bacterium]
MNTLEVLADAGGHASEALTTRKVLLAGDTVFASLQQFVPDNFVRQAPREAVGGLFAQFRKNVKKVYLSIDDRIFDIPSKVRFGIAMEGYIAWGLRHSRRDTLILFGGAETDKATDVSIFVFVNGEVAEIDEKLLPATSATFFRDALTSMLGELRMKYPTARYTQAAPLTDWEEPGINYVGNQPIAGISYRPLTRTYSQGSAYVLPGAVALAGALFYSGALLAGWMEFDSAMDAYDRSMADPAIRNQGGIDVRLLDAMTTRRQYMDEPRRQAVLAEKLPNIVRGIGVLPSVQILDIKLPAPSINPSLQFGVTVSPEQAQQRQAIGPDRPPDVWMSIGIPKTPEPAINQAKTAMTAMANSTGMSLRLAHAGWRDDGKRRVLNIEGFIHDDGAEKK